MAESSLVPLHHDFDLDRCLRYLESINSPKSVAVSRYQTFVTSGPDSFLLLFQKCLRRHDVKKILGYLRSFGILDVPDCERISSKKISDLMVTELVTMISTKDPHAFWYFTHSLKTNALFQYFHGDAHCCVCEDVQAKEKEIDETLSLDVFPEDKGTIFPFNKVPIVIEINRFILRVQRHVKNSARDGKLAKDLNKKLQRHKKELQDKLDDFCQVVGPPIREVGMAIGTFVKNATTKAAEARNQKNETQNQPLPVSIAIPTDESETGDAEFLVVVDDTKLELQDEEAGYKMASKPAKPKSIVSAVPTFDAVEGKKKYIAFVIFTVVSLYSYVDSIIKIIPI